MRRRGGDSVTGGQIVVLDRKNHPIQRTNKEAASFCSWCQVLQTDAERNPGERDDKREKMLIPPGQEAGGSNTIYLCPQVCAQSPAHR